MKERPILFSAPMVRALLAGKKTQTRRVLKPDGRYRLEAVAPADGGPARCPYGQPGDRLWVREAHSIGPGPGTQLQPGETAGALRWPHVTYLADGAVERRDTRWRGSFGKARPSIHMPRWASRIMLEVAAVRVERLQDISIEDAKAEGAWPDESIVQQVMDHFGIDAFDANPRKAYRMIWEQINGPGSWEANPWVWVVEFRRLRSSQP